MKTRFVGVGIIVMLLGFGPRAVAICGAEARPPIAVIVHPNNPLKAITLEELRRFFLGTSTTLPNREAVILLESAEVRERFYASALRMSMDRIKRHWIGMVFSGESGTPPREVGGSDALLQFVATHPGGIAFLKASEVTGAVRVLMVEGLPPSDPRYPLR